MFVTVTRAQICHANENKIKLSLVDEFRNNDGETIIDTQMISHISYDSTDTTRLEILNK